jgi:predicted HicB family RNase H-like nuclease
MKKQKSVPYNVRFPDPKLKAKLEKQAKEENRSLNQHIIYWLDLCASGKVVKRETVNA